jgi:DNA topoisomerase-2
MKERKAVQITPIESVRKRPSTYVGSMNPEYHYIWLYDEATKSFSHASFMVAPGLLKIIDEIIVNAIDQYVHYPEQVKNIKISIDGESIISVYNDGYGFNLHQKTKTIEDTEVWIPELCAGYMFSGDNYDDSENRNTGGMNGIGMKATNIFSEIFTLDTRDKEIRFKQVFYDQLRRRDDPIIKTYKDEKQYTKISFKPKYSEFKQELTPELLATLRSYIFARAFHTAAFTRATVTCCGEVLPKLNFDKFCQMYVGDNFLATETVPDKSSSNQGHELKIGFSSHSIGGCIIVANGIISSGGTISKYFKEQITRKLKDKTTKMVTSLIGDDIKISSEKLHESSFLFIMGFINNPRYRSQCKDQVDNNVEQFKGYILSDSFIDKCWKVIELRIREICQGIVRKKLTATSSKKTINIAHYEPARTKKNRTNATLCIVEGLSAAGLLSNAIAQTEKTGLSSEWYGIFPTTGVPANALKKINGEVADVCDLQKIMNNKRFSELIQVLGLNCDHKYDLTPEGDAEYLKLNYGQIILVTDQDLDGHNICGLFCVNLASFWPNLIKRSYIKKLSTPIIRAFDKKSNFEFYSNSNYKNWAATHEATKFDIKYYCIIK